MPFRRDSAFGQRIYAYGWALFAMSRPSQLAAVTLVYLLGAGIARANAVPINMEAFVIGYLALIPVSASIHYVNEYADHETDALTVRTPFSGGSGALQASGLPRRLALQAGWGALIGGMILALYGWNTGVLSPLALVVLALGAFFGWMYSLKPLALAWRGWGELDNAALGGLLLPLYGYVALSGHMDWWVVKVCVPFFLLVFVNLLAVTWADREADAAVGKFTLATRWSLRQLRFLYWVVVVGAYVLVVLLLPPVVAGMSFIAAPVSIWGGLTYTRQHSPLPTVAAMMVMLFAQLGGWLIVGG